jgi:hypothetical protein
MLAGLVCLAVGTGAYAQQAPPQPTAAGPGGAAVPAQQQAVEGPQVLGNPGPDLSPQQITPREPPRVHVSIVSPQDSRFSKRLRNGAEDQRVPRARSQSVSGMRTPAAGSFDTQ